MPLSPSQQYLLLNSSGNAEEIEGGAKFWSLPAAVLNEHGKNWLLSEFTFSKNWPTWEMHPEADEVIYITEGRAEVLLQQPSGLEHIALEAPSMLVVPRGVWHTAQLSEPCRMLFITMGAGTQHRPVLSEA
jgi:mannose-6-phosphate isomerase-like protein (cupin superfamily)